jgi:hypothetical protein
MAALVTAPFWFPVLLAVVSFCLLIVASAILVALLISLIILIWILKLFHNTYYGLIKARQGVIKEIGADLNSITLWRFFRLIINRHLHELKRLEELSNEQKKEEENYPIDD